MQLNATFASFAPAGGQKVAVGAASAASTAINAHDGTVRLMSTVDCFIEVGTPGLTPTAVVDTSVYLPAYSPEYIYIGANSKIACIQVAAGGFLYISQC